MLYHLKEMGLKMRAFSWILGLLLAAGSADAAIVRYEYTGNPMVCPTSDACGSYESATRTLSGSALFDLDLIPGGTLRNRRVSITANEDDRNVWTMAYRISGSAGVYAKSWTTTSYDGPDWSAAPFLAWDGDFGSAFAPFIIGGVFEARFDKQERLVDWFIAGTEGGGGDWVSNSRGDGNGYGLRSYHRGLWARNGVPQGPVPVPLPAMIAPLLMALAALGWISRRRSLSFLA